MQLVARQKAPQTRRMARHYLCLPVDLSDDPRTRHLGGLLAADPLPLLVRLCSWAVRQSPDGMIGTYPDAVLASAAGWSGDAASFATALRKSDWLLADGMIADWGELYRVEARRIAATVTKAKQRARKPSRALSTGQSGGHPLNSLISDHEEISLGSEITKRSLGGESERGRPIPPLSDPWWSTDAATLRAYLLAIPGPEPLLALPDPEQPSRSVLESLQARFPAWDGLDGRPTLQERAQSTWDALRARAAKYTSDPYRAIVSWRGWVGDRHDQAAQRIRRTTGEHDPALLLSSLVPRREN